MKNLVLPILLTISMSFLAQAQDINFTFRSLTKDKVTVDITPKNNRCWVPQSYSKVVQGWQDGEIVFSLNQDESPWVCKDYPLDISFTSAFASQSVKCSVDQGHFGKYTFTCITEGSKGDGSLIITPSQFIKEASVDDKNPLDVTLSMTNTLSKAASLNFQFTNNASYPVTIDWDQSKTSCWSPRSTLGSTFAPQIVPPGKTYNLDQTFIDDTGKCRTEASNMGFTFSTPYASISGIFTEVKNALHYAYGKEGGDGTLGVRTTVAPNTTKIQFTDRTTMASPVTFQFVNLSGVPIHIEQVGLGSCWDTGKGFPFQLVSQAGQKHDVITHTRILNSKECVNNGSSSLTLRFSSGLSKNQFTINKPYNDPIPVQEDTSQKDYYVSISPAGVDPNKTIYIIFIKPLKVNGKPVFKAPQK